MIPNITLQLPKIFIGHGAVENNIGVIVKSLGAKRVLIVTDKGVVQAGLVDKVTQPLEKEKVEFGIFDGCEPDAPIATIKSCAKFAKGGGYDLFISIGGGSTIDTGKIASVLATAENIDKEDPNQYFVRGVSRPGLRRIHIPTTAGTGAELTRALMVTDEDNHKRVIFMGDYGRPEAAIIDPLMTLNLPQRITADGGIDALTHAIEGYTHIGANILSDMFNETVIRLVSDNLRLAYCNGAANVEARYNMSIAATFSLVGQTLGPSVTLAHAMAQSMQKETNCTHGISVAILEPYVMEFNMLTNPQKHARIGEIMGEQTVGLSLRDAAQKGPDAVRKLTADIEMPQKLRDIGVKKEQLPGFVGLLFSETGDMITNLRLANNNPRIISKSDILRLFELAW